MIKYIRKLRKDLLIIFCVALVIIFSVDIYLNEIPELFDKGAELGQILYKLSLSYISAFIFYFLVVHIKLQRDKKNIALYLNDKVITVFGTAHGMFLSMSQNAGITLRGKYPNKEEIHQICLAINPLNNADIIIAPGINGNWLHYLDYNKSRTTEAIDKTLKIIPFLDANLVNLIVNIQDCHYFKQLTTILQFPIKNKDLTFLETLFLEYIDNVILLEKYYESKLKIV